MGVDRVGVLFVLLGLMALAAALLPRLLSRAPVSMPMVVLAGGIALFAAVPSLPTPDPLQYGTVSTHLSEVCSSNGRQGLAGPRHCSLLCYKGIGMRLHLRHYVRRCSWSVHLLYLL